MSVYFSGASSHSCYSYKEKAIPVMGHGSIQGCEMLKIPHCLDNQQSARLGYDLSCQILFSS
jgi:hypothetical protein